MSTPGSRGVGVSIVFEFECACACVSEEEYLMMEARSMEGMETGKVHQADDGEDEDMLPLLPQQPPQQLPTMSGEDDGPSFIAATKRGLLFFLCRMASALHRLGVFLRRGDAIVNEIGASTFVVSISELVSSKLV